MLEQPELASYLLQTNLIYTGSPVNVRGSFNVWKKGMEFGFADDLMRWCPKTGCLGLFNFSFALTEQDLDKIKKNVRRLNEGKDDPALELSPRFWPKDIQKKHNDWYIEKVVCTKCGTVAPRESLADSYGFNMSLDRVAERMVDIFFVLDNNADVYLVRNLRDKILHEAKSELRESVKPNLDKYNKLLEEARQREQVFYPLKNIVKDTQLGGLKERFLSLLKA